MRTEQNPSQTRRVLSVLDRLVFCALCAAAVLIPLQRHRYAAVFAVLCGASVLLLLSALDKRAAKKEAGRIRAETARAIRLEKLLMLPDEAIRAALNEPSLLFLRSEHPSGAEILAALRSHPRVLAHLTDPAEIEPLIRAYSPETRLLDADALLNGLSLSCTEEEVDRRQSFASKKRRNPLRFSWHALGNRRKFLLLGTLLLVLSLVWKYKIYYRLLASLCFTMTAFSGGFGEQNRRRNFANFLDKREK